MPTLVIKVNPLTYYNNNSTKEKYPNLHCYINLNNNFILFKLMLPYSKSIRARTCKSQTTYHYNNCIVTWNTCCHIYIKMTHVCGYFLQYAQEPRCFSVMRGWTGVNRSKWFRWWVQTTASLFSNLLAPTLSRNLY